MPLDFSKNGFADSFQQALREGINLFCGAGFSVGAVDIEGHKLPVGAGLLTELKQNFLDIGSYTNLSRACTKLCKTDKTALYSFLERRFKVHTFDELYHLLKRINIKNVYTANINDLFFKIYEDSLLYLNGGSQAGASYDEALAIHYHPLHDCIRNEGDYVFDVIDLVKVYLRQGNTQSWQYLANLSF